MTDTELAEALRHEDALRRLAWMLHLGAADADDAVQHAMTQAALGKRPPGMSLWLFLRTALKHHAWNARKLARRRRAREGACARDDVELPVDEMLARDQLRRRVADAVVALAEPYRTTVWLRWFEGFGVDEIAAHMQAPANTVRTRLQRAHAQLKVRLDRDYCDGRWRALAAPLALAGGAPLPLVPLASAAATVAAVLGVAAALTFALAGGDPVPEPVADVAAAAALEPAAAPDPFAVARVTAPLPVTTPVRVAAAPAAALRVEHGDGRVAAGLPVWWWTAEDAPEWIGRARDASFARGVDDATDEPEPERTVLRTDPRGCIVIPSPRPVAVTVELAANLWFSAELPHAGPLVLPDIWPGEVTMLRARPGSTWEAEVHACSRDATRTLARVRVDVDTRSGPGSVRYHATAATAAHDDILRIALPAAPDLQWEVRGRGHGFLVEPAPRRLRAPFTTSLRAGRRVPRVVVTVLEPDGSRTARRGTVRLRADGAPPALQALARGQTVFDLATMGALIDVRLRMANGEDAAATTHLAQHQWEHRIELRVAGSAPVQQVLADGLGAVVLHRVFVEDDRGDWQPVARAGEADGHPPIEHGVDGDVLWLAGLPFVAGRRVCYVAADGRTGLATLSWLGRATGEWLRSSTPVSVNVTDLHRDCGFRPALRAELSLGLPTPLGEPCWTVLWSHELGARGAAQRRPPRWRELALPDALPARVRVLEDGRAPPTVLLDRLLR